MKIAPLGLVVALGLASLASGQIICGEPQSTFLIAGQHIDAGDVVLANDENYLYVTFITADGWTLTETHVAVGPTLASLPQNRAGNPKVGNFKYKGTHDNLTTVVYTIPLAELGVTGCGAVAAHAVVEKSDGAKVQEETAWGAGAKFTGRNWAMYMTFCEEPCEEGD